MSSSKLQDSKLMINFQPGLWSAFLPPALPFLVGQLSPWVLLRHLVLQSLGMSVMGQKKTGTWENERRSLIRCLLALILFHVGQMQIRWNEFILNPKYHSHPCMIIAMHVAKTHERSSICSSYPAKCSTVITTHLFWTREAQSCATKKIRLILPPADSCYLEEYPEDENTD